MKELTRIVTLQITMIADVKSESAILPKEDAAERMIADIKEDYGVDDVVVTNVQDFITDKN